jgi:hypothetical protein
MTGLPFPTLMFLAALDPVREEITAGRAVEVPAREGAAVLFRELSQALAERLHGSGACLGCSWYFRSEEEEEHSPDMTARGLFTYSHLTDPLIPGPYGRVSLPARPIHVDQLPPRIRDAVKAVCFDTLRFADTTHIQPVEHAPCVSRVPAYLDVTGEKIGPIPGKEEEYAAAHDELADIAAEDQVTVEPLPGTGADEE